MQKAIVTSVAEAAEPEEAELVQSARDGDPRAFEHLYRRLAPSVYGLCLRVANNSAEAQDCTQDAFIRAWRQLAEFRGDSKFTTWLHRIAVNEVLGRKRRHAMEQRHDGG